jgi:iron complex outermembrane receptor protein
LLRVGAEYQHYRLDDWWPPSGGGMWPGIFENIKNGKRDRTALFGEWESTISEKWMTSLGLRYEHVKTDADDVHGYSTAVAAMGNQFADANAFNARNHERSDNNWDMAALARYTADATQDIEFGFARKVRSPNLYERYTWSTWSMAAVMNNFVGDGNGYVGNPDLEPEAADTVSATLTWHSADRRRELRVAPYYTRVEDYIDAVRRMMFTPGNFNVLTYANQSARLQGIDLSGRVPLGQTPIGELGLQAVVSYVDGRNRVSGDDLYNIMPLNARLRLTHRSGGWDNSLELVAVAAKDEVADVRSEIPTSAYELVNLSASYSWQRIRVDLAVENLLDRFYSLPLGGAYIGQGRTMSMTGIPWGIPVPGRGRSVNVGLTARF